MLATPLFRFGYGQLLKPIFFRQDAETVHDRMLRVGERLGRFSGTRALTRWCFAYQNPVLTQRLAGLDFPNPIGLPGGFDKNARIWTILPEVGFGFMELGSITAQASNGNPKPRLARWPKGESLVVNYGLTNDGAKVIRERLPLKAKVPLGLNVAVTNTQEILNVDAAVADYLSSLKILADRGDYYTINISCPNRVSDKLFVTPENLEKLLRGLDQLKITKPVFLKLSPDLSEAELEGIVEAVRGHWVTGFIAGNLTKNRARLPDSETLPKGGLSGAAVRELSDRQIRWLYRRTKGQLVIIGCGGVFTAAQAYRKIKLGASLVQVLTGMIFFGPQRIGEINRGLVELLKRDGCTNVSQAVGREA